MFSNLRVLGDLLSSQSLQHSTSLSYMDPSSQIDLGLHQIEMGQKEKLQHSLQP